MPRDKVINYPIKEFSEKFNKFTGTVSFIRNGILFEKAIFRRGEFHSYTEPAYVRFRTLAFYGKGGPVQIWYANGQKHREGGPASIHYDLQGTGKTVYQWYYNGLYHREDGPAFVAEEGGYTVHQRYFLNGNFLTEDEYIAWQRSKKLEVFFKEDF